MGGRGAWSATSSGRTEGPQGGGSNNPSEKLNAAEYQRILDGDKVSVANTLANAETLIRHERREIGLIVDEDGFVLTARRGDVRSVNFVGEEHLIAGNIVTHNHPSGFAVFSENDLFSTAGLKGRGIRATGWRSDGSPVTISLTALTSNADFKKYAQEYHDALPGLIKEAQGYPPQSARFYNVFNNWHQEHVDARKLRFTFN
jgi:hypothetical protein